LVGVLCTLDLDKVKLSDEDKFFSYERKDYVFGFSSDSRDRIVREAKIRRRWKKEKKSIQDAVSKENELISKRHAEEVEALNLTPEEKNLIEIELPALVERNAKEAEDNLKHLETQVKEIYGKTELDILAKLPPRFKALVEKQQAERAELDKKNEILLTSKEAISLQGLTSTTNVSRLPNKLRTKENK
jgi:hypothetical protein